MAERFGANDALVQQVLAGKSPRGARRGVGEKDEAQGCRFPQATFEAPARPRWSREGSDDRARPPDRSPAREARKVLEAQDETKQQAYAEIAKARFALAGDKHLSGRDLHPASLLRAGAWLRGRWQTGPAFNDLCRSL